MSIFKKIGAIFSPRDTSDDQTYWLHVRCGTCGEELRTRVDLVNDLSVRYGEPGEMDTYICRKTMMGSSRCFRRIAVTLTFDTRRRLIGHEIEGGDFIAPEDLDA